MSDLLSLTSADAAILFASLAGLGVLLLFVGAHQVMKIEVSLTDRLAGWGAAAEMFPDGSRRRYAMKSSVRPMSSIGRLRSMPIVTQPPAR